MQILFDGKLLPDINKEGPAIVFKERIAVQSCKVKSDGAMTFFGAPSIDSGSGENIATAVFDLLNKWGVADRSVCTCFDTTASNTGKDNGACAILARKLGRKLLNCACRHHIFEIHLKCAFESIFGVNKNPDVPFFNEFRRIWPNLDQNKYTSGMADVLVRCKISSGVSADIKLFCKDMLNF